ncbi:hypothetical protein D3C72_1975510 [compost metagenome]
MPRATPLTHTSPQGRISRRTLTGTGLGFGASSEATDACGAAGAAVGASGGAAGWAAAGSEGFTVAPNGASVAFRVGDGKSPGA